jgi:hypothetical protein
MIFGTGEGGIARLKCTKEGLSVLRYQGNRTIIAQIAQIAQRLHKNCQASLQFEEPVMSSLIDHFSHVMFF